MSQNNRYKKSAQKINKDSKANRHINLVVIVYVVLLGYLSFLIYHTLTKDEIHFVYAEQGIIHEEGEFNGLIIRNETVVTAKESGPIKYFVGEGSKVRQNSYVCVINQDPEQEAIINDKINAHLSKLNDATALSVDDYKILKQKIKDYVFDKERHNVKFTYSSKEILEGTLSDIASTVFIKDEALFQQIQNNLAISEESQSNNGSYLRMKDSGIVSYTIDGFEDVTLDNLSTDIFKQEVSTQDVSENGTIKYNDPVYKVVDNYMLYIVSKLDPRLSKHIEERNYVTLYFPQKNINIDARIQKSIYLDNEEYVVFSIDRYFDNFFTDRFIDYKVVYNDFRGLKIPNQSVVTKELIKVPSTSYESIEGQMKIKKLVYSDTETNHETTETVSVKVYYEEDDFAYVQVINDDEFLDYKDHILYRPEGGKVVKQEEYIIDHPEMISGVYIVNYGYTDFKRVKTIYEDDNFQIVDPYIKNSVSHYDKIVTDASTVNEFNTLN